jgi:hypothetical protein
MLNKIQIIDVQGGNIDYFLKYLPQKLSEDKDFQQSKTLSNIYVITPSNVVTEFKEKGVNFTTMFVYYGHLSMEDTPHMAAIYNSSKNILFQNESKLLYGTTKIQFRKEKQVWFNFWDDISF